LARDGRKTCKARGLSGFESSKLGHFDQQSEGGDPRDAGDARQDREAVGEFRIGFDEGENGRVDGGDLTFDLVEALRILPFQQRKRPDFGTVLGGSAIFDQRFAGDVKLLEFGKNIAADGAHIEVEECAHAGEQRCIEAIGLGELAGRLREAACLRGVDLDEWQASVCSKAR
jgi:hypothetical protein